MRGANRPGGMREPPCSTFGVFGDHYVYQLSRLRGDLEEPGHSTDGGGGDGGMGGDGDGAGESERSLLKCVSWANLAWSIADAQLDLLRAWRRFTEVRCLSDDPVSSRGRDRLGSAEDSFGGKEGIESTTSSNASPTKLRSSLNKTLTVYPASGSPSGGGGSTPQMGPLSTPRGSPAKGAKGGLLSSPPPMLPGGKLATVNRLLTGPGGKGGKGGAESKGGKDDGDEEKAGAETKTVATGAGKSGKSFGFGKVALASGGGGGPMALQRQDSHDAPSRYNGDLMSFDVVKCLTEALSQCDARIATQAGYADSMVLQERCEMLLSMVHHQLKEVQVRAVDPSRSQVRQRANQRLSLERSRKLLTQLETTYACAFPLPAPPPASAPMTRANQPLRLPLLASLLIIFRHVRQLEGGAEGGEGAEGGVEEGFVGRNRKREIHDIRLKCMRHVSACLHEAAQASSLSDGDEDGSSGTHDTHHGGGGGRRGPAALAAGVLTTTEPVGRAIFRVGLALVSVLYWQLCPTLSSSSLSSRGAGEVDGPESK